MARPRKSGIDYFSFDCGFFRNPKIRKVKARYGILGVYAYIYLLSDIYDSGYYIKFDEDYRYVVADEIGINKDTFVELVVYLVRTELFNRDLFYSASVLTSKTLQLRWQEAVRERAKKTPLEVCDYWLLGEAETKTFIKVTQKKVFPGKNPSYSREVPRKNPSSSWEKLHKVKESKVKESKECVETHESTQKNTHAAHKNLTNEEYDQLIKDFGITVTEDYIHRTSKYKSCNNETIRKWIAEDKERNKSSKTKSSNKFNDFDQRDYSSEELSEIERKKLGL